MKILVTGSTGFVGRHLIPKLKGAGHEIAEITIELDVSYKLFGNSTFKIEVSENQVEFVREVEIFNPDIVIHLASYLTSADDYNTLEKLLHVNIRFFCRLLDALKNCDLKLFINTGTFAEYLKGDGVFNPAYLYSATKTASRSFLNYYSKVYNFKQITVVPYTIYGGNDMQKKIVDIIFDSLDNTAPLDLTPGNQVLDFIHVEDVSDFFLEVLDYINSIANCTTFQLGTGYGYTLKDLVEIMEAQTGMNANINWGGKKYRPQDVMFATANISKQYHLFKWKAKVSLKEGVEKYLATKKDY